MHTPHTLNVFFFNDTATTEIYTLSLHDALPIYRAPGRTNGRPERLPHALTRAFHRSTPRPKRNGPCSLHGRRSDLATGRDRKSTRLNSSHANISYAVFCLKKKNIPDSKSLFRHP